MVCICLAQGVALLGGAALIGVGVFFVQVSVAIG